MQIFTLTINDLRRTLHQIMPKLKYYIPPLPQNPLNKEYTIYVLHMKLNSYTVKCRCNERQYNEIFRITKLFLGPFPFPYLMCVKIFHFNEFRTFSITN